MKEYTIPETFLKSLADNTGLYSKCWLSWLLNYADDFQEIDFLEKFNFKDAKLKEDVEKILSEGLQILQQGDFKISGISKKSNNYTYEQKHLVDRVIDYLNQSIQSTFSSKTESTITKIIARNKEGFVYEDFIKVIDNQVAAWLGTENEKYLRPVTLFRKEKFENYLNAKKTIDGNSSKSTEQRIQKFGNIIKQAKQSFIPSTKQ